MNATRQLGIYARLNRSLRRVLVICILLALGLLAGWLTLQDRVGDEIRREVERRFAAHYPGYRVTVQDARLVAGQGIEIQGLAIYRRPEIEPLVSVDRIMVVCPVCVDDLVRNGPPPADRLLLQGVQLRARQDPEGNWDLARLWPPPKFGPRTPKLTVRGGRVQIVSGEDAALRTFELRNLQLDAAPEDARTAAAQPAADGTGGSMRVRGCVAGDHFENLQFEALLPAQGGPWSVNGRMAGLQLSPPLHEVIPEPWRGKCSELASISGRVALGFQVAGNSLGNEPPRLAVAGTMSDGQIVDRRLPFRLYDARGEFRWDGRQLEISQFFARNGACELELSLTRRGLAETSPLSLVARARRLTLDRRFVEVLPKSHQSVWRQYFPLGVIDADVKLEYDGRQWIPEAQVQCHDVSFVYHRFPYRLERAHGSIALKQDQLSVELQAAAGSQTVSIKGWIRQPGDEATGWVEVACKRPIPLDEKLLDAVIDPKAKAVIRSLNPGGTLAMVGRFERRQPGGEFHKFVRIDLHNCTMRYDRFPYPLGMIRGSMVWDDRGWTFQNLSGRNDSGYIECEGSWTPAGDSGSRLTLRFIGTDVPLEDELREALTPGAQRVWQDVHPRGTLDHLQVTLNYDSPHNDLSLEVRGQKWKKRSGDEGRSITVTPGWFPYRLDDVTGLFVYRDGDVFLQGVSARHDDTAVSLDGRCRIEPDGRWAVDLNQLVVDRMRFDEDALNALPEELGRAIGRLSPRGNFSLQGSLAHRGDANGRQPTASGWDLTVDVDNGSLNCGLHLDKIHGDVRLIGNRLGDSFASRGELNVDSLIYQDLQLTQIRGPLLIERDRVVLGAEAERDRADAPPRSLVAQAVGGTLSSDVVVYLEGDVPFRLRAALERGDLQQFAREMSPHNQQIRGQANALVNLAGTAQGRHTWRGDGFIRLFEADIYEIPVMLALLKMLSIRRPDRTAFTSSDIDFRIQGEHLYFDRINFHGDAISLKGRGEMNLDREINMEFYTLVGRREWDPPALRALLQQAAQQILLIRATGTLDQPHLTREALPMVRETLEQLFPEVAARNQNARTGPAGLR